MNTQRTFSEHNTVVATTQQLLAAGATERELANSVQAGALVRARRGRYVSSDADAHTIAAVRVGGRLACVSAASALGIFVFDATSTHVHLERNRSRLRSPRNQRQQVSPGNRDGVTLHWSPLSEPESAHAHTVGVRDCLAQMVRCQEEHMAIAALDSALHQCLIDAETLDEIFAQLPKRYRAMRDRVNGRSESGQESVLRLIVEEMGLAYEIQANIDGVGRVDMVIEGVLVVEADSRAHHKEWNQHVQDRKRDRLVAARGYMTLRLIYRDIMFDVEGVRSAIRGLLAARLGAAPL